jgi:hypothetical protein
MIEQEEHTTEINGQTYTVKVYYNRFIYNIAPSTGKPINRRHDWSICVEPPDDEDECYYLYMWFNEDADHMDITSDLIPELWYGGPSSEVLQRIRDHTGIDLTELLYIYS